MNTTNQTIQTEKVVPEFDTRLAILSKKNLFKPFEVKKTEPLRDVVKRGEVTEEREILMMENDRGGLALLTDQMSYHHIAQGEVEGKPWLVSF